MGDAATTIKLIPTAALFFGPRGRIQAFARGALPPQLALGPVRVLLQFRVESVAIGK